MDTKNSKTILKIQTDSPDQTQEFAKKFAQKFLHKSAIIALFGDLGAGKTTFTKGFALGLGISEQIISPTFVLHRIHKFQDRILNHIDLYRLNQNLNPKDLGLDDLFEDPNAITLIEWPEKLAQLPDNAIEIHIEKSINNSRLFTIFEPKEN